MPFFVLDARDEGVQFDEDKIFVTSGGEVSLMPEAQVDPYQVSMVLVDYGFITFRNAWVAGVEEIFNFSIISDLGRDLLYDASGSGGKIEFQVSVDNGVTWMYFDGSSWLLVNDDSDVSSLRQLDQGASSIPFKSDKQFRLKAKISSDASKTLSPTISRAAVGTKIKSKLHFEDIYRTIKKYIEDNITIPFSFRESLVTNASSLTLNHPIDRSVSIISVYNLTTDPDRTSNIFSSYDSSTKIVTLSSQQYAGHIIEVNFEGKPLIFLDADVDFSVDVDKKVPAYIIIIETGEHFDDNSRGIKETLVNRANLQFRSYNYREWIDWEVHIHSIAASQTTAIKMANAVNQLMMGTIPVYSKLFGYEYLVPDIIMSYNTEDLVQESLIDRNSIFLVSTLNWSDTYEEGNLVEEFIFLTEELIPIISNPQQGIEKLKDIYGGQNG